MRKILFSLLTFAVLLSLLFGGCTVQDEMNAEIFAERFCLSGGYTPVRNEMIFTADKALYYTKSESGTTVLLGMQTTNNENVTSVCASVDFTLSNSRQQAYSDFTRAVESCVCIYAPGDFAEYKLIEKELLLEKGLAGDVTEYHDTQWYRYSLVVTEGSAYFSVESKRAVPDTGVEYSLK